MLYVVMQDQEGSVTAVDVKRHEGGRANYPLGDKRRVQTASRSTPFTACCSPPAARLWPIRLQNPPKPMMVVLSATDGKILANLPLAGNSDGAAFNPQTHGGVFRRRATER
jgi:hypothetical protein